jgi:hypothetical protein
MRRQVHDYALAGEPKRYAHTFDWLAKQQPTVDEALIRELHDRAVGGREYRSTELSPVAGFTFPSPDLLPGLVSGACARAGQAGSPAVAAAALHLDMLTVHPYADGNGRTSRLLGSALLMRAGYRSTLFTALEEFFHPAPRRYVQLLDSFRFAKICREACILRLLDAMFVASAPAAWFLARERAVDEAMRAAGLDPEQHRDQREAIECARTPNRASPLASELRARGLSNRREAMNSLSAPARALVLRQVDRLMCERREAATAPR